VTPARTRTCDVTEKGHFITKVRYKFLVLVWTKLNTIM